MLFPNAGLQTGWNAVKVTTWSLVIGQFPNANTVGGKTPRCNLCRQGGMQ